MKSWLELSNVQAASHTFCGQRQYLNGEVDELIKKKEWNSKPSMRSRTEHRRGLRLFYILYFQNYWGPLWDKDIFMPRFNINFDQPHHVYLVIYYHVSYGRERYGMRGLLTRSTLRLYEFTCISAGAQICYPPSMLHYLDNY